MHNFFEEKKIKTPDLSFDICLELELNPSIPVELRESKKRHVSGCYAFIDFGFVRGKINVLYVGTASRLWNRVRDHIYEKNGKTNGFIGKWYDNWFCEKMGGSGAIECFIWLENKYRYQLEVDLIKKLQPIYNDRLNH